VGCLYSISSAVLTCKTIALILKLSEQQRYLNEMRVQTEQKHGSEVGRLPAKFDGCADREHRDDRNCCRDRNQRMESNRAPGGANDNSEQAGAVDEIAARFLAPKGRSVFLNLAETSA